MMRTFSGCFFLYFLCWRRVGSEWAVQRARGCGSAGRRIIGGSPGQRWICEVSWSWAAGRHIKEGSCSPERETPAYYSLAPSLRELVSFDSGAPIGRSGRSAHSLHGPWLRSSCYSLASLAHSTRRVSRAIKPIYKPMLMAGHIKDRVDFLLSSCGQCVGSKQGQKRASPA